MAAMKECGWKMDGQTDDGLQAGWTNTTDYTDPYITRMDQKAR